LQTHLPRLVVAGGVGANLALRQALQKMALQENIQVYFPRLEFCTDNGAMVAYAGAQHLLRGKHDDDLQIDVHARIALKSILNPIP
jgi:N6-L-threonylcarbamoyladenine synthase